MAYMACDDQQSLSMYGGVYSTPTINALMLSKLASTNSSNPERPISKLLRQRSAYCGYLLAVRWLGVNVQCSRKRKYSPPFTNVIISGRICSGLTYASSHKSANCKGVIQGQNARKNNAGYAV